MDLKVDHEFRRVIIKKWKAKIKQNDQKIRTKRLMQQKGKGRNRSKWS